MEIDLNQVTSTVMPQVQSQDQKVKKLNQSLILHVQSLENSDKRFEGRCWYCLLHVYASRTSRKSFITCTQTSLMIGLS